jgi:hypothetical protein
MIAVKAVMTRISLKRINDTASLGTPNGLLPVNIPAFERNVESGPLPSNDSYTKWEFFAEGEIPSRVYAEFIPVLKVRGIT